MSRSCTGTRSCLACCPAPPLTPTTSLNRPTTATGPRSDRSGRAAWAQHLVGLAGVCVWREWAWVYGRKSTILEAFGWPVIAPQVCCPRGVEVSRRRGVQRGVRRSLHPAAMRHLSCGSRRPPGGGVLALLLLAHAGPALGMSKSKRESPATATHMPTTATHMPHYRHAHTEPTATHTPSPGARCDASW